MKSSSYLFALNINKHYVHKVSLFGAENVSEHFVKDIE